MAKRVLSSGITPTMKASAKRVVGTRAFNETIGWDRKLGTRKIERANLGLSITNTTSINLNQQLMTSLATKYKINTANGTQFAELMKALKENRISIDTAAGQREFAKVFLGQNPTRAQLEELKKILLDYKKQMTIQENLENSTKGIKNISASVASDGRIYVKEKKGFWATLFGK
ncbi:MAG TPA: hypothetical protein PKK60_02130 [archaeon]|nr:hypothetical protein [archaeon]